MGNTKPLSFAEREQISNFAFNGFNISTIAIKLKRSKSSISYEVRRDGMTLKTYRAHKAQVHADKFRKKCGRKRKINLNIDSILEILIIENRMSPEQASAYLKKNYPGIPEVEISCETIYNYIYTTTSGKRFYRYLRRKRPYRHKYGCPRRRGRSSIPNRISIHDRNPEIDKRITIGHWEGDLIIGKNNRSAIGTLVERKTRYTILIPITSRDSDTVMNAFAERLKELPAALRVSLTYDNGSEAYHHHILYKKCGMQMYFADPGKPWQRGSNENTNGLIREFFPKGAELNKIEIKEIKSVEALLNKRPRKILGFRSPQEVFQEESLNIY